MSFYLLTALSASDNPWRVVFSPLYLIFLLAIWGFNFRKDHRICYTKSLSWSAVFSYSAQPSSCWMSLPTDTNVALSLPNAYIERLGRLWSPCGPSLTVRKRAVYAIVPEPNTRSFETKLLFWILSFSQAATCSQRHRVARFSVLDPVALLRYVSFVPSISFRTVFWLDIGL